MGASRVNPNNSREKIVIGNDFGEVTIESYKNALRRGTPLEYNIPKTEAECRKALKQLDKKMERYTKPTVVPKKATPPKTQVKKPLSKKRAEKFTGEVKNKKCSKTGKPLRNTQLSWRSGYLECRADIKNSLKKQYVKRLGLCSLSLFEL